MPQQDKTGPMGAGPKTGRRMGSCGIGYGLGPGRGYGRAMCGWFYRQYQTMPKAERKDLLEQEIVDLKEELQMVQKELEELES